MDVHDVYEAIYNYYMVHDVYYDLLTLTDTPQ